MQSVSSMIWTRVAVFISYDDSHYTTGTSKFSINNQQWLMCQKNKPNQKNETNSCSASLCINLIQSKWFWNRLLLVIAYMTLSGVLFLLFLNRLVIGDLKWILYDKVKLRHQSINRRKWSAQQLRRRLHPKMSMLSIWWDRINIWRKGYMETSQG